MSAVEVADKGALARFFGRDLDRHIYEIGDLDPFFWPRTRWFALESGGDWRAVVLQYAAPGQPTVLALGPDLEASAELVLSISDRLPARVYAHLAPGLAARLEHRFEVDLQGPHLKMSLRDPSRLAELAARDAERLTAAVLPDLEGLYAAAYPNTWFDPAMLDTKQYFGVRRGTELVCVAGVHVFAPEHEVAAIGNVATHPRWRGRGLAGAVTARLCQSLRESCSTVGLNVAADNAAALACYRRLGFERVSAYDEAMLTRRV